MSIMLQLLLCVAMTLAALFSARRLTHIFQLESYQFRGYFKSVARQWKRTILPYAAVGAAMGVAGAAVCGTTAGGMRLPLIGGGLAVIAAALLMLRLRRTDAGRKEKKRFALTARMKRLYACLGAVLLGAQAALLFAAGLPVGAYGALLALLPLLVAAAAVVALPIEKCIFLLYFHDAERKLLQNERLIRIGITGSYGKTSTKFILAEILSQKYHVLATPASFNTPMGVTRIIRERLQPAHQVFIGEMGARHVGEIRELCRLVHPTIGLLTAIGPQHLDTFKTIERIRDTKYELIDALPADGLAVFQADGALVSQCWQKTNKPKLLVGEVGSDAWAKDVQVGSYGSRFTLCLPGWAGIPCETRLLGEHNIRNILMATAVAKHLGLSREQIARGVAALKPVEHRLQLLQSAGGVTVIDDAFNTNPTSSKRALDVLRGFSGRRVIVTPGMVELGAEEARFNEEFGRYMAGCVDVAVLVGRKHTAPIAQGLRAAGFAPENIHVVSSLDEASALNRTLLRAGDVVMYENDLPDHYSEG